MTSLKNIIDPRRKKNKSISEMVCEEKVWKYNVDKIKKHISFAIGVNAIANIFNRIHNKVRSCKLNEECKETKKSRCDALRKGMNNLYTISQKELLLGSALLSTIRDCQTLTIKAYLNKVIID